MYDESYGLRFDIYERVHLSDDLVGIDQLEEVELTPHIQVIPSGDQVTVRGSLLLAGVYIGATQQRKSESLEHWIPVEITLPLNRVRSLEDICVDIEHFDVDLLSTRSLNITGVLSLKGITVEQPAVQAWEPEQITVTHESAPESEEPTWLRDYDQGERPYLAQEVVPASLASLSQQEAPEAQISNVNQESLNRTQPDASYIPQVSEQYAANLYQQFSNPSSAPNEALAFAERVESGYQQPAQASPQVQAEEESQAQGAQELSYEYASRIEQQPEQPAIETATYEQEVTPQELTQAASAQDEQERLFAVNAEASPYDTEAAQPLWGDLLAKKAQTHPEAEPAPKPQAEFLVSSEDSKAPAANLTWSDTPWSKASVSSGVQAAADDAAEAEFRNEAQQEETEASAIAEETIEEIQREAEEILAQEEQERERDAEVALEAEDEPAPIVQEKKEMKVAIGSAKPANPSTAEQIGYSSILSSSMQTKEKERAAEQRINEAEAQAEAQAYEEVHWQSLFLNRVQDDRGFKKVRMCIVQRDETLDTIAGRYEMHPREIALYNRLEEDSITQGQVLYIPS
ncbi:LysM peptidoglycan-binding domain-containing protein [Paenibacillus sp. 1001270B_150601_E10]|uniref:LysM peptidoglycan-binding domain-containing protein n=1 Tax=Paenibacillus sp. 1001270B_150601_E10 TaxID=2787079 RepID=UPI002B4C1809|nr:LysM peptidoglycan-binding domain-containing protein [Paenibacillus sp. 1001270B_150601_E10]